MVLDALSRRADHVLSLKEMSLRDPQLAKRIKSAYHMDLWSKQMIQYLEGELNDVDSNVERQAMNFSFNGEFLHWKGSENDRVYIPDVENLRRDVIAGFHDVSHLGADKIFNSVTRFTYWSKAYEDVVPFVSSCPDCQRNKMENRKPAGELQPLQIPEKCWEKVAADFVTKFPRNRNGNDTVLIIVDRLLKRGIFIPTSENIDAPQVVMLFQDHLFSKHGVPIVIGSDRDPKFKSHY